MIMKRSLLFFVLIALFIGGTSYAAELNIYASGLRLHGATAAEQVTDENQVHIDYFLNAPANDLKFLVLDATTGDSLTSVTIPAGTNNENYAKGSHENVVVDLSEFHGEGNTYKWAIKASAGANASLTKISDSSTKYILYAPKGVIVNSYPETDAFGTIYVSMPADGQSDGGTTTSQGQKQGIFVWDAGLNLQNTGNAGYKGNLTWQTDNAYGAYRLKVAENGDLYMGASHASVHNLYKISSDFSTFTPLLNHAPKVSGFEIVGDKIYVQEGIGYSEPNCLGAIKLYDIDELPASEAGDTYVTSATTMTANANASLDSDGKGGFWICQNRTTDASSMPIIAHLSKSKSVDYNSSSASLGLSVSTRGAMGVSPDKSLLAVCTGPKGSKKIFLFSISWSAAATPVPSLTKVAEASVGNNVDGIAFDYANNLYSVNSSTELLYVWATPKSTNTCTTPAASSRTIVLTSPPANLEEAVENKTIRRTLMNGGKLFVLAIDGQNKPFIYKINPETSAVEAVIPTTGCTTPNDKTLACGITTLSLSDIAFTNDNVLVGINAEHMKYNSSFGTLRLYKWSDLSATPTLWASSTNSNAVGNFSESITGAALTFVGNSATGNSQAITIAVTTGTTAEYRYVYFNMIDGEHDKTQFNRSVASGTSDIKASTIGTDVQLHPSPLSGDFIITGSSCRPIEVIESANNVAATYNKTEAINAPTVGSCFFTEDAVKYMAIPTSAGISIYNITSGLATASLVTSVAASNTAEYRAVFAVRDEDDLILYLQKDDEISKYTEDNFFGVTINSVTLNKSETSLTVGETETLTAEVDPDDAVVTVIWESDDESVATVSDAGVVTAVSAGTTTITATAGDKSDECTVTVTAPIPMSGTYKIGGAEADYASLHAACEDINQRSLSDDVTFLICADLTESQNSGLVNTTDYTLTIKPDADADRTITFNKTANDNVGPSGGLVIGDMSENIGWTATPTKNVIIDGLASAEATHKMTFETTSNYVSGYGPIVFYGHVTNSVIRNCKVIGRKTYALALRTEKNTNNSPEGIIVENNIIETTTINNGQSICIHGADATTPKTGAPKNTIIRNNEIKSTTRGIFLYGANGATIEGNTFKLNQRASGMCSHAILGNSQTGTITVRENKFVELTTPNIENGTYGMRGITAEGGAIKWIIENNYFGGLDATATNISGKNTMLVYLYCKDLCEVSHNTFHMPSLTKKPATTLASTDPISCLLINSNAAHIVKNNIFLSEETAAHNSLISGTLNDNILSNVFYHNGGNAALTSSGSAIGDLDASNKWMPVAFTESYKLDFESANNSLIDVTPISGITTDIEGRTRTNPTHAGCYEPSRGLVLNEEAANNDAIGAKDGQTMDVLLKRHFLVDDGLYTLVLPFDLDNEQLEEAFGVGYKLSVMQTAYFKTSDALYLKFGFVDHLEAGVPCLLRVGNDVTEDILFRDVTIDNADPVKNVDGVVEMRGLYDMTNVPAAVTNYYLGTDDYLFQYKTAIDTKAFRSYFYFPGFATSAPPRVARVIFREDVATDDLMIEDAPATAAPEKIIRDGEMLIIVDGVEYDMMGRPRVR